MAIDHETGTIASGDVSIFYRRLGERNRALTPILILHGLSYCSYDWLEVAQALALHREVACMDMRGFGESGWSAKHDYSVPTMGADIVNLLDHLAWRRTVLIGHSMGGRSATFAAAKHPERVCALALIDYSPENAPAGSRRVAETVAGTPERFASLEEAMLYFKASPAEKERYQNYLQPSEGGFVVKRDPFFREQFRRTLASGERPKLGVDMWQLIGEVKCPILSVRGTRSDLYAAETMEKMKRANARLTVCEVDAGHNIGAENPHALLAVLHPFLESLEESHERTS